MENILHDFIKDSDCVKLIVKDTDEMELKEKIDKINSRIIFYRYKKVFVLNSLFHDKLINFFEFSENEHNIFIYPRMIKLFNNKYCR